MSRSITIKKLPSMLRLSGEADGKGILCGSCQDGLYQMKEAKTEAPRPAGTEPVFGAYHERLLQSCKGILQIETQEQVLEEMMGNAGRCLSAYYERHPDGLPSAP